MSSLLHEVDNRRLYRADMRRRLTKTANRVVNEQRKRYYSIVDSRIGFVFDLPRLFCFFSFVLYVSC